MKKNGSSIALGGRVKVQAVEADGTVVRETPWINNLILDQGMNALATTMIADLFAYCAAGTAAIDTKRTPSGTISQGALSSTATASAAVFSLDDVGGLILTDAGAQRKIIGFIDVNNVTVDVIGAIIATPYKIYEVDQVKLTAETKRTNTYGATVNDNKTTTVSDVRTMKRTFLFPPETAPVTYREIGFSHLPQRPTRDIFSLTAGVDVIEVELEENHFLVTGLSVVLAGITGASPDINGTRVVTVTGPKTFTVPALGVTTAGTNGTVTPASNESNLNIRITLHPTGGTNDEIAVAANQRLKVIYELKVSVSPETQQTGTANIGGAGAGGAEFGNVAAKWVIEKFATSLVNLDGSTDATSPELEPCYEGAMAMSDEGAALVPLNGPKRDLNVSVVPLAFVADFVPGVWNRQTSGMFDLEDGNSSAIRSLMIYDETGGYGAFTVKFDNAQTKNGNHSLTIIWGKSWSRTLN